MKITMTLRDAVSILHSRVHDCWRCPKRYTPECTLEIKAKRCLTTAQYKQFIYLLKTHPHFAKTADAEGLESGKTEDDSSYMFDD